MATTEGALIQRVQIVRPIGRGAGSDVFLARDPANGHRYALKVVKRRSADDQKYIDQAVHEYEVARRLNHPNLLKAYDIRRKRRWGFLGICEVNTLLEYVDGQVLEQLQPELPVAVAILVEVARALEHMHGRGVCHADLKPNNVIVDWQGNVKVIDFGLAWLKGQDKQRIQGTRGYLAPEQVLHRRVTPRTDIFNFGVLAHRLLTGTMRSQRADGHAIGLSGMTLRDIRDMNPAVPERLARLVRRCCAEKPEQRPESMEQVRAELEAIAEQLQADRATIADHMQSVLQKRRRWQE